MANIVVQREGDSKTFGWPPGFILEKDQTVEIRLADVSRIEEVPESLKPLPDGPGNAKRFKYTGADEATFRISARPITTGAEGGNSTTLTITGSGSGRRPGGSKSKT